MMSGTRLANGILSFSCFFCVALAAYLISTRGWASHYLFLILAGGGLLAGLRLRPSIKVNLALVILSTACSLYGAEFILGQVPATVLDTNWSRWLAWPEDEYSSKIRLERRRQQNFDRRNRYEVIRDLSREGIDAVPPIGASLLLGPDASHVLVPMVRIDGMQVLPFGGISNKTTVYCNESGEYTVYQSDEYGFHNPAGIWGKQPIEVALVGDSFVHGACVPSSKNIASLVRAQYPATINVGMGANGPLIELATLREYLALVKPRLVFWVYYEGNDLSDLSAERRSPLLMSYLTTYNGQDLSMHQEAIDRGLTSHVKKIMKDIEVSSAKDGVVRYSESFFKLSRLREKFRQVRWSVAGNGEQDLGVPVLASEETVSLFRMILQKADESVKAWGGRMVVVYLPGWERYGNPSSANQDRGRILELVRALGIPVVDIHKTFVAQEDPLRFFPLRLKGHYNEQGNKIVAEEMLKFVEESGWLRARSEIHASAHL